jgi:ribonuclease HI
MKNNLTSGSARYRTETAKTLDEDYGKHVKIYTDGSKMGDKVGYAVVKEECKIKKKILPQNTVFSAEQSAIIGAIQSEKNNRHEIVIITDSLIRIMAAENHTPTKNPKTQTIRKILDHEGPRITLLWVPSHVGIPGNEKAAKEAQDEDISTTERYSPYDLKIWLTEEVFKKRDQRRKNGNNDMKERKADVDRKEDTKRMPRKEQVAISRFRTSETQNEGHSQTQDGRGQQSTMPLLQHLSIRRPHTVRMQRN